MLASVHLVDGGAGSTVRALRHTPKPAAVDGLRGAWTLVAAPLCEATRPQLGRRAVIAFWDDVEALDAFGTHPEASPLMGGFRARLEPVRAVPIAGQHWPQVPAELPTGLIVDDGGPAVVLTIGRLRVGRAIPFFRASAKAERQVAGSPGVLWATGLANPAQRIVATLSVWSDTPQMRAYVTGTSGHTAAMREQQARSFHHVGSFIRFRPIAASGSLSGRNPLPASVATTLDAGRTRRPSP
jgi:hypothetical protein